MFASFLGLFGQGKVKRPCSSTYSNNSCTNSLRKEYLHCSTFCNEGRLSSLFNILILMGQSSWMRMTQGHRWPLFRHNGNHFWMLRTLLSMLFAFVEMDLHIIGIYEEVIETFKCLCHKGGRKTMSEVIQAHMYQLLLCKIMCAQSENSQYGDEIQDIFICYSQLAPKRLILQVLQNCQKNSCSIGNQLTIEFSRILKYHVNITPSSDCTNSCNSNASFVVIGPFFTGSHCDMKWKMR